MLRAFAALAIIVSVPFISGSSVQVKLATGPVTKIDFDGTRMIGSCPENPCEQGFTCENRKCVAKY